MTSEQLREVLDNLRRGIPEQAKRGLDAIWRANESMRPRTLEAAGIMAEGARDSFQDDMRKANSAMDAGFASALREGQGISTDIKNASADAYGYLEALATQVMGTAPTPEEMNTLLASAASMVPDIPMSVDIPASPSYAMGDPRALMPYAPPPAADVRPAFVDYLPSVEIGPVDLSAAIPGTRPVATGSGGGFLGYGGMPVREVAAPQPVVAAPRQAPVDIVAANQHMPFGSPLMANPYAAAPVAAPAPIVAAQAAPVAAAAPQTVVAQEAPVVQSTQTGATAPSQADPSTPPTQAAPARPTPSGAGPERPMSDMDRKAAAMVQIYEVAATAGLLNNEETTFKDFVQLFRVKTAPPEGSPAQAQDDTTARQMAHLQGLRNSSEGMAGTQVTPDEVQPNTPAPEPAHRTVQSAPQPMNTEADARGA